MRGSNWRTLYVVILIILFAGFGTGCGGSETISAQDEEAFALNARLGRGINFGNALDAPREGAWGVVLEEEYFGLVAEAGFDAVRIPVRWSACTTMTGISRVCGFWCNSHRIAS